MPFWRRFLLKWPKVASAAILILTLTLPAKGSAQEVEVGDTMALMETAFIELVKSILIVPVQETLDEPNFVEVEKRAGQIIRIARTLPKIENYKDDKSFRNFARNLENMGERLSGLAKKKQVDATVDALIKVQDACLQCHRDFRF